MTSNKGDQKTVLIILSSHKQADHTLHWLKKVAKLAFITSSNWYRHRLDYKRRQVRQGTTKGGKQQHFEVSQTHLKFSNS